MSRKLNNPEILSWLLRLGLAFVFLYAAVSSLRHPLEWAVFLPAFLTKAIAGTTLIKLFAVYELVFMALALYFAEKER